MQINKKILIVDDENSFRSHLAKLFERKGYLINEAKTGREALRLTSNNRFDVILLDIVLPDIDGIQVLHSLKDQATEAQIIIMTGNATIDNAIESMKSGAYDYLTKPFDIEELTILIERACELTNLRRESRHLHHELARQRKFDEFVGSDKKTVMILDLVARVAPTDSTILITGETGTGKELIAKAIHRQSGRYRKPFIVINCSAIQETLLESELFGYEKGAFTGAEKDKSGLIEVANTGTLFLDEVGELTPALQIKLLRFLEDGEYRPVGSTRSLHADVRLIAATNRDLKALIATSKFRRDLFYRLNVINIQLPPLRRRPADIRELTRYFMKKICHRTGKCIPNIDDKALAVLQQYHWPGNVRELENVLERAVILTKSDSITVADLPADIIYPNPASENGSGADTISSIERQHIMKVLRDTGGNKTKAARILGITKKTLYARLHAYELK